MAGGQDRAYSVLRLRVVGGHYPPGFHLREEPLARELGLSRTPVRAALRRLVEDGLATTDAGQGIHVTEWSEADIEETFRLRILLEAHATERAVARGDEELAKRLEASNQIMASAMQKATTSRSRSFKRPTGSFIAPYSSSPARLGSVRSSSQ